MSKRQGHRPGLRTRREAVGGEGDESGSAISSLRRPSGFLEKNSTGGPEGQARGLTKTTEYSH